MPAKRPVWIDFFSHLGVAKYLKSMSYAFDISQNIDSREFTRKILRRKDLETGPPAKCFRIDDESGKIMYLLGLGLFVHFKEPTGSLTIRCRVGIEVKEIWVEKIRLG
jgi:hypothetical protein